MLSVTDRITSVKNPKIKLALSLQKSRDRKQQHLFPIEGIKEIEKAVTSGYSFKTVFFNPDLMDLESLSALFKGNVPAAVFEVSKEVYEKLAYRENTGGVMVLAEPATHALSELTLRANPLLLVLESVEKPGNLGALLRTADAAGADAVIVCDPQTDLYNPNVVRSSLGCLFTVPVAVCTSAEAIAWMRQLQISIYCTYLQAAKPYYQVDFGKPAAIVMGTESVGITDLWVHSSDQNIIIPMQGVADSLNVSTAAAIVLFEACRQRTV